MAVFGPKMFAKPRVEEILLPEAEDTWLSPESFFPKIVAGWLNAIVANTLDRADFHILPPKTSGALHSVIDQVNHANQVPLNMLPRCPYFSSQTKPLTDTSADEICFCKVVRKFTGGGSCPETFGLRDSLAQHTTTRVPSLKGELLN